MSAIIDIVYRAQNAQIFAQDFGSASYYMLIADQLPWSDETNPPVATTYLQDTYALWDGAYGAKRVTSNNVALGIRKSVWAAGVVYDQYDAYDTQLHQRYFYVLNSEFNVYKVLSNYGAAQSTVEPTGTNANPFVTSDGYRWKYMYTIGAGLSGFITPDFMPVEPSSTNGIAPGTLESFRITNGGAGYTPNSNFSVTITGDGSSATATAYTNAGGIVTHVETVVSGSGYSHATVSLPAPVSGTTATALANLSPPSGHGSNNVIELFARFVTINVPLVYDESGTFSIANDYRQVFLVRNPNLYGTLTHATGTSYRQSTKMTLTGITGAFQNDEVITSAGGTKTGTVVEYNSSGTPALYINEMTKVAFASGNIITGSTSGATATVGTITTPGLQPNTGVIVYYENRVSTPRAANQIENVLVVLEY